MRFFPLLFLLVSCATARPQVPTAVDNFYLDPVGKEYLLLTDGALVTDNPLGQNRFVFFDSSLGRPDVVDVTNPFAVLLFYADYGSVVLLDRTLSEIRRLDLYNIEGVDQPTTIARATDNGIWLFDSWDYRLKLMDQRGKVTTSSNDLRLTLKITDEPAAVYVYQNLVLLHFTDANRLAVLTNYGRFQRWVDLPDGEDHAWLDGRLAARDTTDRWTFDLRTNKVARTQVQGEVGERWLPLGTGFRHLDPKTNTTRLVEN